MKYSIEKIKRDGLYEQMKSDWFILKNSEWSRQWGMCSHVGLKEFGVKTNISKEIIVSDKMRMDWMDLTVGKFVSKYKIGIKRAYTLMGKKLNSRIDKISRIENIFKSNGYNTIKDYLNKNGYFETCMKYGLPYTTLSYHIKRKDIVSPYKKYNY